MFSIDVSNEVLSHCKTQVENFNFWKRYTTNGTKEQQLTGIVDQSIVMQLFKLGMINGTRGFDGGVINY